jgi:hypothetical protein
VFSQLKQKMHVISTEATHGFIVNSAVERSLYFVVAVVFFPKVKTNSRHFDRSCLQSHREQRGGETRLST